MPRLGCLPSLREERPSACVAEIVRRGQSTRSGDKPSSVEEVEYGNFPAGREGCFWRIVDVKLNEHVHHKCLLKSQSLAQVLTLCLSVAPYWKVLHWILSISALCFSKCGTNASIAVWMIESVNH